MMELPVKSNGYKTVENARRKANSLADKVPGKFIIAVTDKGRFMPVAVHYERDHMMYLVHQGLMVV